MKAIIPVAGFGSRLLPATKSIPKEMLPLLDKPLIQYVIEECVYAGITEVVLVTHSSKQAIESHFDTHFELEASLVSQGKSAELMEVKGASPCGVTIVSVRQHQAKGLGHAVSCAQSVVGNEPFVVLLPDVILNQNSYDSNTDNLKAMVERHEATGNSQVMLEPVSPHEVDKYGVADLEGAKINAGEFVPVRSFVEKPPVDETPSNLVVVGRYVFSAGIWDKLKQTGVGAGGEIQLTDAMDMLLKDEEIEAYHMVGKSDDCGSKLGYIKAFIEYAIQDPRFSKDVKGFIKTLM